MSQNLLVVQGEYQVSDQADAVISTLLGSCIATCLFDPRVGVGGLNHFLLAGNNGGGGEIENLKYGVHAMELLINSLLRLGARRLRFHPATGRVQLRLVDRSTVIELPSVNPPISSGSELDLF